MECLMEYLEFISPDSKIEIVHHGIIFSGSAGEAQTTLSNEVLTKRDVVGTMFEQGILAIYIY